MTYTPPAGATIQQTVTTTATGAFTDSVARHHAGHLVRAGIVRRDARLSRPPTSAVCLFQGG